MCFYYGRRWDMHLFDPVTLKMHRLTPKSIGFVSDPYPTMMPNTMLLVIDKIHDKRVYITEYANFAYFDLELCDLDLDPRSCDINHLLSPSMAYYIKKEQIRYLSIYLSCGRKRQNLYFHDLDLENVPIDPKINRLRP